MTTATETYTARAIFKCRRGCQFVWKREATSDVHPSQAASRAAGSSMICPNCRRWDVMGTLVTGTYNAAKQCNARCMGATSGACECQCAGENHGASH